jgi:hypothetical protein
MGKADRTGPHLGWHRAATTPLSIDFVFGGTCDIDSLAIHADDADGMGSVSMPASVRIAWSGASTTFDVQDPPGAAPRWLTFSGLGIAGTSESTCR